LPEFVERLHSWDAKRLADLAFFAVAAGLVGAVAVRLVEAAAGAGAVAGLAMLGLVLAGAVELVTVVVVLLVEGLQFG
jgi:hypothetical protein